jgi:B12 binding domain/Radical SAM superfamily
VNVVLVDNLLIEQNGGRVETVLQPHLGLISLLSVVRASGHRGLLYDPKISLSNGALSLDSALYSTIARQILALEPDVVGLTSLGCNFICTLKVAQHIRSLVPHVPILLGGPHATILHADILRRYEAFDVVVRHEAEEVLPKLLEQLPTGELHSIPGITFRAKGRVCVNPGSPLIDDLDRLPIPSYDDYPIQQLQLNWLRVEAGRGCPFMCTFCSTASFFGRQFRLKSAPRLLAELDELHARYGVRQFSLQHDLFTVSREKVLEFCKAVAPRSFIWKCSARMDCVDAALLREMAEAGCKEIYFGVETGSPYLQHAAKKRLDLSIFYPTLDACDAVGIEPTVSFITGYPQERTVDQAATLDMIGSCFYRSPAPANVQLHLMTPEPGTQLLQEFQDKLRFDGFISDFTFPTLEADDATTMAAAPDVFMNAYYFEGVLPRRRHIVVSTLYYVLYDLSPAVLSYLIDQFDGRLSALVDAFDHWALEHNIDRATGNHLVRFVREQFGKTHPVTSLVRYMVALAAMIRPTRRQAVPAPKKRVVHRGADFRYVTNPDARLLKDIHDCPALLAQLASLQEARRGVESRGAGDSDRGSWRHGAASPQLLLRQAAQDFSLFSRRHDPIKLRSDSAPVGHFLVVPIPGTDEVRNVRVDTDIQPLLDVFRHPVTLSAFRQALQTKRTPPLVRELINIGVLAASSQPA